MNTKKQRLTNKNWRIRGTPFRPFGNLAVEEIIRRIKKEEQGRSLGMMLSDDEATMYEKNLLIEQNPKKIREILDVLKGRGPKSIAALSLALIRSASEHGEMHIKTKMISNALLEIKKDLEKIKNTSIVSDVALDIEAEVVRVYKELKPTEEEKNILERSVVSTINAIGAF